MATVLNNQTFDAFIGSNETVLVDFWAVWCGPCRMLAPVIEELANENPTLKVGKVDVDECEELARRFEIMSIPTCLLFKNGKLVGKTVGYMPKKALQDKISEIL